MTKLRVCLVSSEIVPFAKTGGLADVATGLSRFLDREGHDVRLFMPLYEDQLRPAIDAGELVLDTRSELTDLALTFGEQEYRVSVSTTPVPGTDAFVYLIDCPELYGREGIYTQDADEHLRFAAFCRATIECCQRMQWAPDVFHCNDWHTGLLPLYLKTTYAWDGLFASTRSLLTIHNIGYQGVFSLDRLEELGLADQRHLLDPDDVDGGVINYLKTGVLHADSLTTVSRTYAREIQTPELGMGLEGALAKQREKLHGIVNGVDYDEWDPATDALIPHNYDRDDLAGKAANKAALLTAFGMSQDPDLPLVGLVSRLTYQKGLELLPDALTQLLERGAMRFVALGSGEEQYESYFQRLRDRYPDLVAYFRGYNNELAHRIEAASDVFLMPSRYEPCGLNQMYSLKYGTVPVVRRTGGLADTVAQFELDSGAGTGFLFEEFTAEALKTALGSALALYGDRSSWDTLVQNGMAADFSWAEQGPKYVALYRSLREPVAETGEASGG